MTAIVSFHPSFAFFYQPYEAGTLQIDIERFGRMVRKELAPKPKRGKVFAQLKDMAKLVNEAKKFHRGVISLDIETMPETPDQPFTGKDPTRALLKSIGFGTPERGISFWMQGAKDEVWRQLGELMSRTDLTFILQNGPWFDLRVLKRYNLHVRRWVDTRDLRRALSNTSRLGLKFMASLATDMWNWKDEVKVKDDKGALTSVPPRQLMKYNALDCVMTSRVYEWLRDDLKTTPPDYKPTVKRLYDVHKQLSIICAKMHTVGIPFSLKNRAWMEQMTTQAVAERKETLVKLASSDGFIPTANGMRSLLFERHKKPGLKNFGLPDPTDKNLWTNEKADAISVKENSLLMWMASGDMPEELFPIIEAWWEVQGEVKRLGYLKSNLLLEALGRDGRLRPGWNSCGTDTMRLSCREPNVMNVEDILRFMMVPEPGWCFVHADKSQLELRVMEAVTNDTMLKKALDTGDVYSFDARIWFNLAPDFDVKKLAPKIRKASKIIHLGRQYRAGLKAVFAQALRQDRTFSFERVRTLVAQFDELFYGTVDYWERETEFVEKNGYSYGRIIGGRHYYPAMPEPSEIANKPIQRTAAEMMNLEMIELDGRLSAEVPQANIIIQLHDAFDVYCREKDVPKVTDIMTKVMNREWTIEGRTREFPVEFKYAYGSQQQTWADVA